MKQVYHFIALNIQRLIYFPIQHVIWKTTFYPSSTGSYGSMNFGYKILNNNSIMYTLLV